MIFSKNFCCFIVRTFEGHGLNVAGNLCGCKIAQHFFRGHVSRQFVLCHRAASEALNGSVKSSAASFKGRIHLFVPSIWGGVKMCAKFYVGIFRDQVSK